jgi:hypothetical protein
MAKLQDKVKQNRDSLANLKILTWKGRAPGAVHYSGYIQFKGEEIQIERKLTLDEAHDLNNMEMLVYQKVNYKRNPGEMSREFLTEKEVIVLAKKIFHRELKKKGAVALVKNKHVCLDAKPILCVCWSSDNYIMRKANKLYKQIDALYEVDETEHDIDYKAIDALEDEWWKIIEELNK